MVPLSAEKEIVRRIAATGRVTFAEFMDMALYWPTGGYYAAVSSSALAPDYFTAPMAHPAFGALLSLQLEEMWRILGSLDPFVVLEPGAGSHRMAEDITAYAAHLTPAFGRALRYVAVDRLVAPSHSDGYSLIQTVAAAGLPFKGVTGCIISNELLDALPVHRVVLHDGRLKEIYVTYRDGRFVEVEDDPSTQALTARLAEEGVTLAEGQRAEVCLAMSAWLQEAAAALERGFVLTIDYGHPAQELYSPQRSQGMLRCYYRHTLSGDPYIRVGRQDITAHVDFTAVAALGARKGMSSQPLVTQAAFLNNLGLRSFIRRLAGSGLDQKERDANRMAMLEMARAGGMGDFKVLLQSKNVEVSTITGVRGADPEWQGRLAALPLPLLGAAHLSLMEARYPHTAQAWGERWP